MAEYPFRFAGTAIGELSEKIPTNIIALNELIKNSYDAGAKEVVIVLDTNRKKLIISDDGIGMGNEEIFTLLQISKSTKKYGKLVNGRYIQGSKGLGFLAVFKFGDIVTWKTVKEIERVFSIDYSVIKDLDDVSGHKVYVSESSNDDIKQGTIIEIDLKDCYGNKHLKSYLEKGINRDKILNAFLDDGFKIKIEINGKEYHTNKITLNDYFSDRRLFHVKYNSDDKDLILEYIEMIKYGKSEDKLFKTKFDFEHSDRYKLEIDLMLFDLTPNTKKNRPNDLFIEPTTPGDKLIPLIYVNKNLFNNFDLFDPEITRYFKTTDVISQMIGYVEIVSDDEEIQYNADRTQFMQNELTDSIKETLSELNKLIQKKGSEIKRKIKEKNQQADNADKNGSREAEGGTAEGGTAEGGAAEGHTDGGGDTGGGTPKDHAGGGSTTGGESTKESGQATLLLNTNEVSLSIYSESVDLSTFVSKLENSSGQAINLDILKYEINGVEYPNKILKFYYPTEFDVLYIYNDPVSGKLTNSLKIKVTEEEPLEAEKSKRILLANHARNGYKINFNQTPIEKLISQLNRLHNYSKISFIEVIACSLRALFELSIYKLEVSGKIEFVFASKIDDKLSQKVTSLIKNICLNNVLLGQITAGLGLPSYQDFKNVIGSIDYTMIIKKCHLGAHKSTNSLVEKDIEEIGKAVSWFLLVASELLNNQNINWSQLGLPWKHTV